MVMRLLAALAFSAVLLGLALAADPKQPTQPAAPTAQQIEAAKKAGKVKVQLDTDKGAIVLELDGTAAPITVANFLNLVKLGFYNGMPFHRVEPGFVIQAGDPRLVGRPEVGYTIADEKSPLKHIKGAIAMARLYRGNQMVPNSASTQFYITLAPQPRLDALGFTVFGHVVKGMEVVEKIAVNDKITKAQELKK
jgi:peptidyl-prolyl cis-trans isomerase B (cyclophilin B)